MYKRYRIGAVVPAYNEEQSVGRVVVDLRALRDHNGHTLIDDIVVCNNASSDNTAAVAKALGARVVNEPRRGYGYACLAAIKTLSSVDIVLFVDADRSVRPTEAYELLTAIADGADVAIGSRVLGNAEPGSMTVPQRAGNSFATWLIRRLWGHTTTDLGPFRAIERDSLRKLHMSDNAYGWTVEMQVKAIQLGMHVAEVPVSYRRRIGVSKISGTTKGVIAAGIGILGTILKLYLKGRRWIPGRDGIAETSDVPARANPD